MREIEKVQRIEPEEIGSRTQIRLFTIGDQGERCQHILASKIETGIQNPILEIRQSTNDRLIGATIKPPIATGKEVKIKDKDAEKASKETVREIQATGLLEDTLTPDAIKQLEQDWVRRDEEMPTIVPFGKSAKELLSRTRNGEKEKERTTGLRQELATRRKSSRAAIEIITKIEEGTLNMSLDKLKIIAKDIDKSGNKEKAAEEIITAKIDEDHFVRMGMSSDGEMVYFIVVTITKKYVIPPKYPKFNPRDQYKKTGLLASLLQTMTTNDTKEDKS
ncbi:MAG: hypothetical protein N4A36_02260 [Candidatus Gracilibacteria bacterium]|jgi:cell division protein FtsB|nr:hypothetical protein [Candidatus Gracilibacteria bacterium]